MGRSKFRSNFRMKGLRSMTSQLLQRKSFNIPRHKLKTYKLCTQEHGYSVMAMIVPLGLPYLTHFIGTSEMSKTRPACLGQS